MTVASAPEAPADASLLTELNEQNFARLRDYIVPTPEELRWEEAVPWRTSFWSAVVEAQARNMPILAWAMNGHPLACT